MTDQARQLDIMANGGFDVNLSTNSVTGDVILDNCNPEVLLLLKEEMDNRLSNPCIGCQHEHTTDPHILDFCHARCDEPLVEIIEMDHEVGGCDDCNELDCVCDDNTLAPLTQAGNSMNELGIDVVRSLPQ